MQREPLRAATSPRMTVSHWCVDRLQNSGIAVPASLVYVPTMHATCKHVRTERKDPRRVFLTSSVKCAGAQGLCSPRKQTALEHPLVARVLCVCATTVGPTRATNKNQQASNTNSMHSKAPLASLQSLVLTSRALGDCKPAIGAIVCMLHMLKATYKLRFPLLSSSSLLIFSPLFTLHKLGSPCNLT